MIVELEAGARVVVDYVNRKAYFNHEGKNKPIQIETFKKMVEDNLIVLTGELDGCWGYKHRVLVEEQARQEYQKDAVRRWLSG